MSSVLYTFFLCVYYYSSALKCHSPSPTARRRWSINPRECGAYFIITSIIYYYILCVYAGEKETTIGSDLLSLIMRVEGSFSVLVEPHIALSQKTRRPFSDDAFKSIVSVPGEKNTPLTTPCGNCNSLIL